MPYNLVKLLSVYFILEIVLILGAASDLQIQNGTSDVSRGGNDTPLNLHIEGNHSDSNSSDDKKHGDGHHGGLHIAAIAYKEVRDPLIFTIIVLLAGVSKIVYHHSNFLSSKVPESCILIILGTVFGAVIHFSGVSKNLPEFFKPHEFFIFLLPPIILEAAYSLHDRTFSENIGSVLLLAVVGTVLACAMLGGTLYGLAEAGAMGAISDVSFMQIMIFSSLIVAVDPVAVLAVFNEIGVNHVLYFLVFGESLLNDGVTVVLYKVFQAYNLMDEITGVHIVVGIVKFFVVCLGGLLLGVLAGIGSAVLTKFSTHVKVAQPIIIFTMAYFGFLMAELFEFSGIISIIGCGLTQMQYAFHNVSDKSRTTIKYFTKVISSANEIIIFLFLGLSLVNDDHDWHTGFTLWTIFFCLVYRFIITFGIIFVINWLDIFRVRKIGLHEQFMISYGGLRGAVCFSLVALLDPVDVPRKHMFVTTTLAVIVFTVFFQGITIKPLVNLLQISLAPEKDPSMYKELNSHVTDHLMAGIEDIIGDHGRNHLREKLQLFDLKYLKPLLQVTPDPCDARLKVFYEHLLLKEHYYHLKLSGAKTQGEMPKLPHVNTEMLLSTLGGNHMQVMQQLPVLERTEIEPIPKPEAQGLSKSAPNTPAVTIDMDKEGILLRRCHTNRRKSAGESGDGDIGARELRSLLKSQRNSRMVLSKYDRNLTSPDSIQEEIHKKSHKNKRLERLVVMDRPAPVQRHNSWSETRSAHAAKVPPRHAMTINFENSGHRGAYDPLAEAGDKSFSLGSPLASPLGSVFEDEEIESQPMLDNSGNKVLRASVKSHKFKLERQMGLDNSGKNVGASMSEEEKVQLLLKKSQEAGSVEDIEIFGPRSI